MRRTANSNLNEQRKFEGRDGFQDSEDQEDVIGETQETQMRTGKLWRFLSQILLTNFILVCSVILIFTRLLLSFSFLFTM